MVKYIKSNDKPWDDNLEFWYTAKHGLGPGTLPKGVSVLDVVEPDVYTTYVRLSRLLDHREELDYEIFPCDNPNKSSITATLNLDDEPLMVCDRCLAAIKSREGYQTTTKDIPEDRLFECEDPDSGWVEMCGTCEWCDEDYPEYELNILI